MAAPSVAEFYAGKNILLTGATGFLGKLTLERILTGCPDVGKIYCIARAKKDVPAQSRMAEVLAQDIFDNLRKTQPDFHHKVVAVGGDIQYENFGMNEEDTKQVLENTNIIINCAATVNFNEVLPLSLQLNVMSVINMIALARKLQNLVCIVHVSTAYSQCDRDHTEEVFYPATVDPKSLCNVVKDLSLETAKQITKPLVAKRPNTYTFTKSLAEDVIRTDAQDLPIAIFRPSIIGATDKAPMPGWSDNLNGTGGIYLAVSMGLVRCMPGDNKAECDMVPVDYCANMIIAIGWRTGTQTALQKECKIYNCVNGATNPFEWGVHNDALVNIIRRHRNTKNPFQYPTFSFVSESMFPLYSTLYHYIPAHLFDTIRFLTGKKPFMVRAQQKISRSIEGYRPFTTKSWTWTQHNVDQMSAEMTDADREQFFFDFRQVDHLKYWEHYFIGTKKFLKDQGNKKKRTLAERNQQAFMVAASVLLICLFISLMIEIFSTNGFLFTAILDGNSGALVNATSTASSSSQMVY